MYCMSTVSLFLARISSRRSKTKVHAASLPLARIGSRGSETGIQKVSGDRYHGLAVGKLIEG